MNEHVFLDDGGHVHHLLSEYLNDDLAAEQREAVRTHLSVCSRCRQDLATLRLTVQLVRQAPIYRAPRSFALPSSIPSRAARSPLSWARAWTGALAAIFLVLLAARLILPHVLSPSLTAVPEVATSSAAVPPTTSAAPSLRIAVAGPAAVPTGTPGAGISESPAVATAPGPGTRIPRPAAPPSSLDTTAPGQLHVFLDVLTLGIGAVGSLLLASLVALVWIGRRRS
ncbi:MAG: zf-HC2 domain-containing protein [Chloroflexi bacterium]|nr:zf-HC2 domain-containing protein [Chloroflexota bacterium]